MNTPPTVSWHGRTLSVVECEKIRIQALKFSQRGSDTATMSLGLHGPRALDRSSP